MDHMETDPAAAHWQPTSASPRSTTDHPTSASSGDEPPLNDHAAGMLPERVRTLNVGPVRLRESLTHIIPLFADTSAFVFVQEAKLHPSAVRNLKKLAHELLPHYAVFVGSLRADPDPGPRLSAVRHEVVTFVQCHLAARASLQDVSRQLEDPSGASTCKLQAGTHFLRTTDINNKVNIV